MELCNHLIKRGKYFVPPPDDGCDFKELFKFLISVGAGLPVDQEGLPVGAWTPELLATAITQIDSNKTGVDLRTVQHWFQDNDKGISADNINWLAKIFGCNEPDAIIEWRAKLSAANRLLVAKRKENRKKMDQRATSEHVVSELGAGGHSAEPTATAFLATPSSHPGWFNLSNTVEALFHGPRASDLPVVVFTGAVALALVSFTLNLHSIVFSLPNGQSKQVGFLWAPNWTATFLVVLPLYLALLVELLNSWKNEWRIELMRRLDEPQTIESWANRVSSASYSYWSVLFATLVVASGYNWTVSYFIPLRDGTIGSLPVDWGRIAIFRPDVVSVSSAMFFSGILFFYNAICAYLFFIGLVFLHTMTRDFLEIARFVPQGQLNPPKQSVSSLSHAVMNGIFRCATLGVVITIFMKLQSSYLVSNSSNILNWLISDFQSVFRGYGELLNEYDNRRSAPGLYYSFFCLLAIFGVYLNASVRMRWALSRSRMVPHSSTSKRSWWTMDAAMVLLVATCLLIGELPGFTLLLIVSSIITTYFFFKPILGRQ